MSTDELTTVHPNELIDAWQRTLPITMNSTDTVTVKADGADPKAIRIHVDTAGHSKLSFDFLCTYVDSREVKVELVDVEKDNRSIDERGEQFQRLAEDYVRNIHECAQALHKLTHHD